jgi:hypothetical protein
MRMRACGRETDAPSMKDGGCEAASYPHGPDPSAAWVQAAHSLARGLQSPSTLKRKHRLCRFAQYMRRAGRCGGRALATPACMTALLPPAARVTGRLPWGRQVAAPVRACGLSADCRHLLAACGNGYIFRFEYARPAPEAVGAAEGGVGGDPDDRPP